MLEGPDRQTADHQQHRQPAALAAAPDLLAIGKTRTGNAGIGGDSILADIHIGAARSHRRRRARLEQIDPHTRKNADPLLEAKSHVILATNLSSAG